MAAVLRRFREDITFRPAPEALQVSFTYPDSQKSQKVESELVSSFKAVCLGEPLRLCVKFLFFHTHGEPWAAIIRSLPVRAAREPPLRRARKWAVSNYRLLPVGNWKEISDIMSLS
jgi:hypothetical protein